MKCLSHKTNIQMKKKSIIDEIVDSGRGAAVAADAGYGTSKVIDSVLRVSRNDPKTIGKFGFTLTGLSFLIGGILYAFYWSKKRNDAKAYEIERRADGDLYTIQQMADENLIRTKSKAGVYRRTKPADDMCDDDLVLDLLNVQKKRKGGNRFGYKNSKQ